MKKKRHRHRETQSLESRRWKRRPEQPRSLRNDHIPIILISVISVICVIRKLIGNKVPIPVYGKGWVFRVWVLGLGAQGCFFWFCFPTESFFSFAEVIVAWRWRKSAWKIACAQHRSRHALATSVITCVVSSAVTNRSKSRKLISPFVFARYTTQQGLQFGILVVVVLVFRQYYCSGAVWFQRILLLLLLDNNKGYYQFFLWQLESLEFVDSSGVNPLRLIYENVLDVVSPLLQQILKKDRL